MAVESDHTEDPDAAARPQSTVRAGSAADPSEHHPRTGSGHRGPATDHRRAADLAREQLKHFSIDERSDAGRAPMALVEKLYTAHEATHELWHCMIEGLDGMDRRDRIAWFNAQRFACFQLAKILGTMRNPLRRTWQSLEGGGVDAAVRGPYPLFDNVSAIFSATPAITRTATYLYACTEWVKGAFLDADKAFDLIVGRRSPGTRGSACTARRCAPTRTMRSASGCAAGGRWRSGSGSRARRILRRRTARCREPEGTR